MNVLEHIADMFESMHTSLRVHASVVVKGLSEKIEELRQFAAEELAPPKAGVNPDPPATEPGVNADPPITDDPPAVEANDPIGQSKRAPKV